MRLKKKKLDPEKMAEFIAKVRGERAARDETYRGQALKLFPHVCARCCQEFSGKELAELTVHHKDNNHMNNPPDGSNWELLCLRCHEKEHQAYEGSGYSAGPTLVHGDAESASGFRPFEALKDKLKPTGGESDSE